MRGLYCLLALATTLVGCGSSPPTRFYALDAVEPQSPAPSGATVTPVKVDAVHIPPLLDRRAMVRGAADHELTISARDRWGANLGEMSRSVLTQDLQSRLPAGAVISPNAPAPRNARGLVVDILTFGPSGSGRVALTCQWSLLEGAPAHPIVLRTTHLTQPAQDTASSQAAGMSALLGKLADQSASAAVQGPAAAAQVGTR